VLHQGSIPFKNFDQMVKMAKDSKQGIVLEGNDDNFIATIESIEELELAIINASPMSKVDRESDAFYRKGISYGLVILLSILVFGFFFKIPKSKSD
jgi:hypothetical protein